jgi:hypothetical protein
MHMKREVMIGYTSKRNGREIREKIGKELKACNVYEGKKEEF